MKLVTNPIDLLQRFGPANEQGRELLLAHSQAVADMAVEVALRVPHLKPDVSFVWEAGILHDIGIAKTHAPSIGCFGDEPYMAHGVIGSKLLKQLGFVRHGDVCERHIGAGLTVDEIIQNNFPLPLRDMCPISVEEQIVGYVDNYFSKGGDSPTEPIPFGVVRKKIGSFGARSLATFDGWVRLFGTI